MEDIRLRGKLSSHTQLPALMLGGNKNAPNRNDCAGEQDWLSLLARKECCNGKQVSKTQSTLSSISSQQTVTVAITDQRPSASAGCEHLWTAAFPELTQQLPSECAPSCMLRTRGQHLSHQGKHCNGHSWDIGHRLLTLEECGIDSQTHRQVL